MSYQIEENANVKGGYDIVEKDSKVVIEMLKSKKHLRPICRKLNLGGGFNGWTPLFFAKKS